jgi:response regulator of citrate/malate metabolism
MKHLLNRKSPCFVLLDDDVFALTMTEKIIRKFCRRPEIRMFSTPKDAIAYLEAGDFIKRGRDMVFMTDLHMPETDGFEVLDRMGRTFKAMGDRVNIFVISSATCPEEIKRVFSYNYVIGFIDKPFSDFKMKQIMDCIQYPL